MEASSIEKIRHSFAHLLATAVRQLYPKAEFGIGPAIANGFYYDFGNVNITNEDLPRIQEQMRKIAQSKHRFKKELWTVQKAKKHFKKEGQLYKLELLQDLAKSKLTKVGMVYTGDVFLDLCRGGHVQNTAELPLDSFKLTHVAGAYWRGSEKNPMLTRIYGVAFATQKELEHYLWQQEEAKKRDHKKLGQELDLFTFSELVGPGLPLFTPKGTMLRDLLDDFVWSLRKKYSDETHGYFLVDIPHLAKKELYETSGHWEKFKHQLFHIVTREGHEFALKPMNCPHHIQVFSRKKWSFRQLPQRYASTTKIYRDEQTGELSGLSRVRSITQDDAHVFCTMAQTEYEIQIIWNILDEFYSAFHLPLQVRLSLRDPKKPKNYLGNEKIWKDAQAILKKVAKGRKVHYAEVQGEAAFYGPKLDFLAKDSLGREWQVATIQVDLNMPKQFGLTFTSDRGDQRDVYMIHSAIMGSIERCMAILIEHYAGAFPFWLAPEQIWILPVSDTFTPYAKEVEKTILSQHEHLRIQVYAENETLQRRIREGEIQKIPLLLIVGEKEMREHTVSVREHGKGNQGTMTFDAFITYLGKELCQFPNA